MQELWEQCHQLKKNPKITDLCSGQLTDTSVLLRAVSALSSGLPEVWGWDFLSALWALGVSGVAELWYLAAGPEQGSPSQASCVPGSEIV